MTPDLSSKGEFTFLTIFLLAFSIHCSLPRKETDIRIMAKITRCHILWRCVTWHDTRASTNQAGNYHQENHNRNHNHSSPYWLTFCTLGTTVVNWSGSSWTFSWLVTVMAPSWHSTSEVHPTPVLFISIKDPPGQPPHPPPCAFFLYFPPLPTLSFSALKSPVLVIPRPLGFNSAFILFFFSSNFRRSNQNWSNLSCRLDITPRLSTSRHVN